MSPAGTSHVRRILAIDPGTTHSGWVLYGDRQVLQSGVADNHDLRVWVREGQGAQLLAIEMIAAQGMAVGRETFETVRWIGRYQESWREPDEVKLVYRHQVKVAVCGDPKARDTNIRRSLIDLFPRSGGGAEPAIGTRMKPGPLYGVSSHAWQALGVAVTACKMFDLEWMLPEAEWETA